MSKTWSWGSKCFETREADWVFRNILLILFDTTFYTTSRYTYIYLYYIHIENLYIRRLQPLLFLFVIHDKALIWECVNYMKKKVHTVQQGGRPMAPSIGFHLNNNNNNNDNNALPIFNHGHWQRTMSDGVELQCKVCVVDQVYKYS